MSLFARLRSIFQPEKASHNNLLSGSGLDFSKGGPYLAGMLGLYGDPERAMDDAGISGIVRLISGTTAKPPLLAYRLSGDDRERVRGHWVEELFKRPNSWMTGWELRRMLTAHIILHGDGYAWKRMSGVRTTELIPWHPSKVRVVQDDPYEPPVYELTGKTGRRIVPATEMFHLRDLTLNGVNGSSRILEDRQGILLSAAARVFGTSYFMNGSEHGVAIEFDRQLTPEQRTQVKDAWNESHQGPYRAHAAAVMEYGGKVKPTSATNQQSQFLELRSFQVEDSARRSQVPAHLIGLMEKQSSWGTGVEQNTIGFLTFSVADYWKAWQTTIQRDIIPENERDIFVEHLIADLLSTDLKTQMESYALAIQNTILSPNEVRKKMNLPPREGGDTYENPNTKTTPSPGANAPADAPLAFPSDAPQRAYMKKIRVVKRAIARRETG